MLHDQQQQALTVAAMARSSSSYVTMYGACSAGKGDWMRVTAAGDAPPNSRGYGSEKIGSLHFSFIPALAWPGHRRSARLYTYNAWVCYAGLGSSYVATH